MKNKIVLLSLVNIGLIVAIFFILNQIGVIEIPFLQKNYKSVSKDLSDDPYLMEQEALKKQWAVLTAKENDLEQRQVAFDKASAQLLEKQKELNRQMDALDSKKKQEEDAASNAAKDEGSIRSLAQKVSNIAPESGAAILNDMEASIAVETIKMMDKMAQEEGKSSTTAYLISLMDPSKRKEVVRLLSNYPSTLGTLNDEVPTPELKQNESTSNPIQ